MRLLYVQPAAGIGGAERQASLVLPHLPAFGVVATAVTGPGTAIIDWFEEAKVAPYRWSPHFPGKVKFSVRGMPAYLAQLNALVSELDLLHACTPFDAVLGSLGYGWAVAGLCGRRWGVPIIWRAGGLSFGQHADPASVEAMGVRLLAKLLRPSLMLCNAEAVRRYWSPMLETPACVVPNGVVLPPAPERRVRHADEPLVLGFAGRIAPEKGLPVLLEACAIARMRGVDVKVELAGPGNVEPIAHQIAALGLEDHVRLLGPLSDLAPFWKRIDALVLPSISEGCANVLLEAMAEAVPILATAVGGTPEFVRHGQEGWLVPPRSPWDLALGIELFARDPAKAASFGAAGRQRAEQHSPEACAEGLANAVRRLVGASASTRRAAPANTPALRTPA